MAKKKTFEPKHTQLRELYEYHHVGKVQPVSVWVYIDYQNEQISLVDQQHKSNASRVPLNAKHYEFKNREIEYMAGWQDILDGIKGAVADATVKLQAYHDDKKAREEAMMIEIAKQS